MAKFIVTRIDSDGLTNISATFVVLNNETLSNEAMVSADVSDVETSGDLRAAIVGEILSWASTHSLPGAVASDVISLRPELATVAITGSYNDLEDLPA